MFTDCPACERQFHIRAHQIRAAEGMVRCGFCGQTFNALERLHDKPVPRSLPDDGPVAPDDGQVAEPEFDIPLADDTGPEADPETDRGADDGDMLAGTGQQTAKTSTGEALAAYDFPQQDAASKPVKPLWLRLLQWFLLFVLLIVITLQLLWFNRDHVLPRVPQLQPWVDMVCRYVDCTSTRFRDLAAIKLLNRDVRLHPRYEDALLVNATIVNNAGFVQPFPVIQLSLLDTDGNIMAHRDFAPADYLQQDYLDSNGMQPDKPVHVVLEISGFSSNAVGFEFNFM